MLNLGTGELLVVLLVALMVLGPAKLPSAARQIGRVLGDLRRVSAGFEAELRDAMREPVEMPPASEGRPAPGANGRSGSEGSAAPDDRSEETGPAPS